MGKKNKGKGFQNTILHFGSKTGLAPGTLKYTGEERTFEPTIDSIRYSTSEADGKKRLSIGQLPKFEELNEESVYWLNINGIHQTALIEQIGQHYKLHPLVLEDIVHAEQRPKLEEYKDYLYLVLRMIKLDENNQFINEQISIVIQKNLLITFQEVPGDVFNPIRERISKNNQKLRKSGADYLLYSVLDAIVDNYFLVLEKLGDDLQSLEIEIMNNPKSTMLAQINNLKRELIYLRKSVWPLREVISLLGKSDNVHIQENTIIYLRDVYDHCVHVIDSIETLRDITSGLQDIYLSTLSHRMNTVMKTLTIIATIFIPLTFIVGVYGMNFDVMPELHYPFGYYLVWVVMLMVSVVMLVYFKRKRWF